MMVFVERDLCFHSDPYLIENLCRVEGQLVGFVDEEAGYGKRIRVLVDGVFDIPEHTNVLEGYELGTLIEFGFCPEDEVDLSVGERLSAEISLRGLLRCGSEFVEAYRLSGKLEKIGSP